MVWRSFAATLLGGLALWVMAADGAVVEPPPNDDFLAAVEVTGDSFTLATDLGAATSEAFEQFIGLGESGRTAWWAWTAPADGIYHWDSNVSSNLVAVTVYQLDAFGQLTRLASTYHRPSANHFPLVPDSTGSFQAKQGNPYRIRLDLAFIDSPLLLPPFFETIESRPVSVSFSKSESVAPSNDHFANRATLTGLDIIFTADLSGATGEANEPQITTNVLRRTLWWSWQAPDFGSALIHARGTNGSTVIGIYSRGLSQSLVLIASSATEYGNDCHREDLALDSVAFDTVPGDWVYIQVDCFPGFLLETPVDLELSFTPAPVNDTADGALTIEGSEASMVASNLAATFRPGELRIPTQSGSNSVWFQWTPQYRGVVQVTRFEPIRYDDPSYIVGGSIGVRIEFRFPCSGDFTNLHPNPPFEPVFGLFTEYLSQTNEPSRPDAQLAYGTNSLIDEVSGGRDYWIQLDGDQNTSGQTPLNLLLTAPPANDDFANRILLPSESLRISGRTHAATLEVTDPHYLEEGRLLHRSVWWEWRAPAAGRWVLFVVRGSGENKFVVYRGGTIVTRREMSSTRREPIIFDCQSGETIQIGVFALTDFGGNLQFTLTPVEAPSLRFDRPFIVRNFGQDFLQLQLPDNSGLPYVVERSDDLVVWSPILTNVSAWSHWLQLPFSRGRLKDFYRTRLQEGSSP